MNYEIGGARVLKSCLAIIWLICGGVTALLVFGDSAPSNLPYTLSTWKSLLSGTGIAAVLTGHFFLSLLTEHRKTSKSAPGVGEFMISLWGMAAVFIGWSAGLACVIATAGGWTPPINNIYAGGLSAGFDTFLIIAAVWLCPLVVLWFFFWLIEGFATKNS